MQEVSDNSKLVIPVKGKKAKLVFCFFKVVHRACVHSIVGLLPFHGVQIEILKGSL